MSINKNPPTYKQLVDYIRHSENEALYEEGILHNLTVGQYLARVEAAADTRPGNWFYGPFSGLSKARDYAKYIASLGSKGIRQNSALPYVWSTGESGNDVDVVRLYQVIHPTPAISSFASPQDETGTQMATSKQIAAARAGVYLHTPTYQGSGHQLSVPVSGAAKNHCVELVKRVVGEEYKVPKN